MTNATHPYDALMDITARPKAVFVRGAGSYLWDDSRKRYLDFVQGWAVNCLGHSPPAIADALATRVSYKLNLRGAKFGRVSALGRGNKAVYAFFDNASVVRARAILKEDSNDL